MLCTKSDKGINCISLKAYFVMAEQVNCLKKVLKMNFTPYVTLKMMSKQW